MTVKLGVLAALTAIVAAGISFGTAHRVASQEPIKIAFLMPCTKCADRWETKDRPFFIEYIKEIDPTIEVIATNAEGDTGKQLAQAEAALAQGADVLVVNTIQEGSAAPIIVMAHKESVPVLAYDGMIKGAVPDAYVSFNNEQVGELQAQYAVDHIPEGGTVALINGDQVCDACRAFKRGAHNVLDPLVTEGKIKLVYETDIKDWLATNAQRAVEQALTANDDKIDAIIAANDTLAQGAIAALKGRNLAGKVLVTGQDASDAAIQHIILGEQTMTVYKGLQAQARAAAEGAVALAKGEDVTKVFPTVVSNGEGDVPSLLLKPVVVDQSNIAETVIADGFTQKEAVCSGPAEGKCNF